MNPDDLIREAYAVVAEPERLFDLQLRLTRAHQRSDRDAALIADHFEQVGELFDALHLGPDADYSTMSLMPLEEQPATGAPAGLLTLDRHLTVRSAAGEIWGGHVPEAGESAPDWLFGDILQTRARVRKSIVQGGENEAFYFRVFAGPDDERGFMVMGQARGRDDQKVMVFARVGLEWHDEHGMHFAEVMGLSETETALARCIVSGKSVSEFAMERGRSVGTARNQMKAVLRKLGIGSQSELISLYAGFASSMSLLEKSAPRIDRPAFGHVAELNDGSQLKFARYGRAGGRPVILLHGAIEGPFLPQNVQHAAQAAGVEVFVPWMPFYAGVERQRDAKQTVETFVARLEQFCVAMKIEQCALLACSVSCAYGFAAATRLPHRFVGFVASAVPIPLGEVQELEGVHPLWRAPLILGRNAPGAVELLVRAVVKLAMRGEAYLYFDRLLKDSPTDRATLLRPDVAAVVRKAFSERPDRAQRSMAHAVLVQALDWSDWLDDLEVPVRVVIGAKDVVHTLKVQLDFCQKHGFEIVGPLDDVGGFALFQIPQVIFGEVVACFDD